MGTIVFRVQLVATIALITVGAYAQNSSDTLAGFYARSITLEDLRTDLTILASDEMEGRDTGKEGQKAAAAFIRDRFITYGIPPLSMGGVSNGYFQPFQLLEERSGALSLKGKGRELSFMQELLYLDEVLKGARKLPKVVYGGKWSDTEPVVRGPVVWLDDDGQGELDRFMTTLRSRAGMASAKGVEVLLVSTQRLGAMVEAFGHYVGGSRMRLAIDGEREQRSRLQVILVDATALEQVVGVRKLARTVEKGPGTTMKAGLRVLHRPQGGLVESENVLAYIEGSDKKEELIVLTAHYDHIGVEHGEVYNGADDDGSGTVAIMAIAKAFAQAKAAGHGPRRSVLVMPVSGEEKGLLGSRYYSERPVFPLENTVANLNIDMIGRVDTNQLDSVPYVYIIGSDRLSSDLHRINEAMNERHVGLLLDHRFNAADDPNRFYYRSDHYNFARKGVPAIFYFSGVHEDYHGPGDTVEKIRFDLLHARTLLVFHTAWELANREERIVVDGKVE